MIIIPNMQKCVKRCYFRKFRTCRRMLKYVLLGNVVLRLRTLRRIFELLKIWMEEKEILTDLRQYKCSAILSRVCLYFNFLYYHSFFVNYFFIKHNLCIFITYKFYLLETYKELNLIKNNITKLKYCCIIKFKIVENQLKYSVLENNRVPPPQILLKENKITYLYKQDIIYKSRRWCISTDWRWSSLSLFYGNI